MPADDQHRRRRRGRGARDAHCSAMRSTASELSLHALDFIFHGRYSIFHGRYFDRGRLLITAVAPVAWGTTYIVTETLPAARPPAVRGRRAGPAGRAGAAGAAPAAARAATGGGRRCAPRRVQHRAVLPAALPGRLPAARRPGRHRAGVVAAGRDGDRAAGDRRASRRTPRRRRASSGPSASGCWCCAPARQISTLGLVAAVGSVHRVGPRLRAGQEVALARPTCSPRSPGSSWPAGWSWSRSPRWSRARRPRCRPPTSAGSLWLTTMGTAVAYYCWFRGLGAGQDVIRSGRPGDQFA